MKIDAYEPCPCGSEKKFKFCCYQKARSDRYNANQYSSYSEKRIDNMIDQEWKSSDLKFCLGFNKDECNGGIIGAHSIQNNRILNRISTQGHILRIGVEITRNGPQTTLKKISKNKASTFFGFCNHHDTKLFKPIEEREYFQSIEQNYLFAFRALSIEYHNKLRQLQVVRNNFQKHPRGAFDKLFVDFYRTSQLDVKGYEEDYYLFKSDFENGNFDNLITFHRRLDGEANFAACSAFAVQNDLQGKVINDIYFDLSEDKMPVIFINIYPIEGGTNVIISFRKEDFHKYGEYISQLKELTDDYLKKYLNFLLINYTENIFFNPSFMEELSKEELDSLLRSFTTSVNLKEKIDLIVKDNYFKFNLFD